MCHRNMSRFLAEFQYRFNRRYALADMLSRLSYVGLSTSPMPYKLPKLAEASAWSRYILEFAREPRADREITIKHDAHISLATPKNRNSEIMNC